MLYCLPFLLLTKFYLQFFRSRLTLVIFLHLVQHDFFIFFTYFFGHESVWSQAAMTAALAGVLAFSLFLIESFDSPYSGVVQVTPAPFQLELVHIKGRGGM